MSYGGTSPHPSPTPRPAAPRPAAPRPAAPRPAAPRPAASRAVLAGLAGLAVVALGAVACSDASNDPVAGGGADVSVIPLPDEAATDQAQEGRTATGEGVTGDADPDGDSGSDGSDPGDTAPDTLASGETTGTGDGDGDGGSDGDGTADQPWFEASLRLAPVASLDQPIALAVHPGSDLLWVAERAGQVRLVDPGPGGEVLPEPAIDLSPKVSTDGERGLLGLTFAPDGTRLYLSYTDKGGDSVISEVPVDGSVEPPRLDAGAERILLEVPQPYSNHNGGDIAIGPDGLLYIALGDGGSGGDPHGHGQDRTTLLGTILRIDPTPSADRPYTIPPTNPFADGTDGTSGTSGTSGSSEARPEIWLWGVRNPWRFSFDRANGDLWVADVGQHDVEEINRLTAAGGGGRGANLGWNLMEGTDSFAGNAPPDHVGPLHQYRHENNRCSITGGYVYRGGAIAALDGVYVYSDFCSGEITGLEVGDRELRAANLLLDRPGSKVISFGQGADGELYVLEQEGRLTRLTPTG